MAHATTYGKLDRSIEAAVLGQWSLRFALGYAATVAALSWLLLGNGFGPALGDLFFGAPTLGNGWLAIATISVAVSPLATIVALVVTARVTAHS